MFPKGKSDHSTFRKYLVPHFTPDVKFRDEEPDNTRELSPELTLGIFNSGERDSLSP